MDKININTSIIQLKFSGTCLLLVIFVFYTRIEYSIYNLLDHNVNELFCSFAREVNIVVSSNPKYPIFRKDCFFSFLINYIITDNIDYLT